MNMFMQVFLYWPDNFSLVVSEKRIPNFDLRKGISEFVQRYNRNVAVLIPVKKQSNWKRLEIPKKYQNYSKPF